MKTSSDPLHAQEKEHDFLLDALGGSRFDAKSDRLLEPAVSRAQSDILNSFSAAIKYNGEKINDIKMIDFIKYLPYKLVFEEICFST